LIIWLSSYHVLHSVGHIDDAVVLCWLRKMCQGDAYLLARRVADVMDPAKMSRHVFPSFLPPPRPYPISSSSDVDAPRTCRIHTTGPSIWDFAHHESATRPEEAGMTRRRLYSRALLAATPQLMGTGWPAEATGPPSEFLVMRRGIFRRALMISRV